MPRRSRRSRGRASTPDTCQYKRCGRRASIICTLDGVAYHLCDEHFKLILAWMEKLGGERGRSSLKWIAVKANKDGRIVSLDVDEERAKADSPPFSTAVETHPPFDKRDITPRAA